MNTTPEITEAEIVQWLAQRADAMRREGGAVSASLSLHVTVGASDRLVTDSYAFAHLDNVAAHENNIGATVTKALAKYGTPELRAIKLREEAAQKLAEAGALELRGKAVAA